MNKYEKVKKEYEDRLADRQTKVHILEKRSKLLSTIRLMIFVLAVALGFCSYFIAFVSWFWLAVPFVAFVIIAVLHDKIIRKKEAANMSVKHYRLGLGRLSDQWQGCGIQGNQYFNEDHQYLADLDLFGKGSLFELLCTTQSTIGEGKLADWLANPATRDEIISRQGAVSELVDQLDLRENMFVLAGEAKDSLRSQFLKEWSNKEPVFSLSAQKWLRFMSFLMSAFSICGLVLTIFTDFGVFIFIAVVLAQLIILRVLKNRVEAVCLEVEGPVQELTALAKILDRIEKEEFKNERLVNAKKDLFVGNVKASKGIGKLGSLVEWLDQGKNQFFAPIGFLLMWRLQFVLSIEKWRSNYGVNIYRWFDALGDLEALLSISAYAFERPDDQFPTITKEDSVVIGKNLKHPLLSKEKSVANSIELGGECRLWVVSGSNMSGKSTFLRVIGVNTVLAMMGAPICGESLTISPIMLGSTIRILDSLNEGKSRFFAEIACLKQIMDLAQSGTPLLFLLDEILHGTNSHDRKIGAQAIIKSLIKHGAIGLVTTHDLALAQTANEMGKQAINVHFDDRVSNGELIFDYLLKQGVVKKSNALELMRSVGLEV